MAIVDQPLCDGGCLFVLGDGPLEFVLGLVDVTNLGMGNREIVPGLRVVGIDGEFRLADLQISFE